MNHPITDNGGPLNMDKLRPEQRVPRFKGHGVINAWGSSEGRHRHLTLTSPSTLQERTLPIRKNRNARPNIQNPLSDSCGISSVDLSSANLLRIVSPPPSSVQRAMRFSASTCASALLQTHLLLAPFLFPQLVSAADDSKKAKTPKPCTARSPSTDRFFDLNPIWLQLPSEDKKKSKDDRTESWKARGYDIGYNFTINFCGPVIEELEDVVGVKESLWKNVSAFYEHDGKTYSIGNQNAEPVFRGRKLVLNYTDGSPCGSSSSRKRAEGLLNERELKGDKGKGHGDDDDEDEDGGRDKGKGKDDKRRKSTIISLLCESDALADTAAISFVAADQDECTYFFEARSSAACGGIEKAAQTLGPGGIFGMM